MRTLTVPWAVSEPPRLKPFTESMEAASILCLADSGRRRPKILKSHAETISYVAKLHYPFWAVAHGEGCLVVDGMGLLSHSMKDLKIPDIKSFTEDLKHAATDFSLFRETIDKHIQTFSDFASTSELRIEALVGDSEVLKAISEFFSESLRSEIRKTEEISTIILKLSEEEALEKSRRLINARAANLLDIRGLQYAIDILKEEMERHKEKIMTEMEEIKRQYDAKLQELEPIVNEKIKQFKADEELKIKKTIEKQEKRLKAALKEQEKLKLEIIRLEKRMENYLRRRTLKQKDKSYIDTKIEICRNRMKEISERIKVISKIAETIRREGDEKIKIIKDEYERRIEKEMEEMNLLEASREAEISMLRSEIEDLSIKVSKIRTNLLQLLEKKKRVISELDSVTFPVNIKEAILMCVPFYLVKYKAGERERLVAFSPINPISHDGPALRLRRAVKLTLESRIRLLLRTRSEALERRIFATFEKRVLEETALKDVVDKVAEQHNLLKSSSFMSMVVEGTEDLIEEGWIEEREKKEILDEYAS